MARLWSEWGQTMVKPNNHPRVDTICEVDISCGLTNEATACRVCKHGPVQRHSAVSSNTIVALSIATCVYIQGPRRVLCSFSMVRDVGGAVVCIHSVINNRSPILVLPNSDNVVSLERLNVKSRTTHGNKPTSHRSAYNMSTMFLL